MSQSALGSSVAGRDSVVFSRQFLGMDRVILSCLCGISIKLAIHGRAILADQLGNLLYLQSHFATIGNSVPLLQSELLMHKYVY